MKKIVSIIGVAVIALAGLATAHAQDVNPSTATTNSGPSHVEQFVANALSSSNITGVVYGTRFNNNKAFGGGFMLLYNIGNYVSAGLGSDYAGEWREFSGTLTVHYVFHPTARLSLTTYGVLAAGSSIGGAGGDNGTLATGEGGGLHANYQISDKWTAGLGAGYITRQNCGDFSGGSEIITASVGWSF